MTAIEWDVVGDRRYETGLDRGVLYMGPGLAVPWNGLTSVDMDSDRATQPSYLDGVKYLDRQQPGDFSGSLKAFTYPDEFEEVLGVRENPIPGVLIHDQPGKVFNLSYRTLVGNDTEGTDYGYKIHLIYNVQAIADAVTYNAMGSETTPSEFNWALTATPEVVPGARPTAHISIDSTRVTHYALRAIEDLLYGTATSLPTFPTVAQLQALAILEGMIVILDHNDGTWSASGPEELITMLDPTTFQITNVNATFSDPSTYTVTTTTLS